MIDIEWIDQIRNKEAEEALTICSELLSLGFNADTRIRYIAEKLSSHNEFQEQIEHETYYTSIGGEAAIKKIADQATNEYVLGADLSPKNKHALPHLVYQLLNSGLSNPPLKFLSILIMLKEESSNGTYVVNGNMKDIMTQIGKAIAKFDIWKKYKSGEWHSLLAPNLFRSQPIDETLRNLGPGGLTQTTFSTGGSLIKPIGGNPDSSHAKTENVDTITPKKCKWTGTPKEFGAIFEKLISQGYIAEIGNLRSTVQLLFDHFEIRSRNGDIVDFKYLYECFREKTKHFTPNEFKIPASGKYAE